MSDTKDIGALAAKNLSDQPAAIPCAAHDLLDRNPLVEQGENGGVGLFAAYIPLILQFLGKGQKRRVDHRSCHGRPDLPHGLPHGIEKGAARVCHQMPSVGDLDRMRKRPLRRGPIAASTIAGDDTDLRLLRQPDLNRGRLPIGQKSDRRTSFKIADQRAVAVIAPPGPVINANNHGRRKASCSTSAHHAQQRIVAHLEVEPTRKRSSRPASERNGETVDHVVEPARTSGSRFDRFESFSKDPPRASRSITEEAAGLQNQGYPDAAAGRSPSRLRYWLCTRLQTPPHIGHRQTVAAPLIAITKPSSSFIALSTTNLRGTSSETSNPCIALIPSPNQSQTGALISSNMS